MQIFWLIDNTTSGDSRQWGSLVVLVMFAEGGPPPTPSRCSTCTVSRRDPQGPRPFVSESAELQTCLTALQNRVQRPRKSYSTANSVEPRGPKSVLKACHGPELLQTSSVEHPTCFHKVLQNVTNAAKANVKLKLTSGSPVNFSPDLINALQASPEVRPLRLLAGSNGARESRSWS